MTQPYPYPNGNSDRQPPAPYPEEFPAVRPEDVAPYRCDHNETDPLCRCVHDWRIEWRNMPRRTQPKATYITGL